MKTLARRSILAIFIGLSLWSNQEAMAAAPAFFELEHDKIPNFAQNPTIQSVQNGSWSDVNSWNPARLPNAGDVVLITHNVIYNSTTGEADTIGIDSNGVLRFKTDQNTRLKVGTLLVMPGGTLEVGTEGNPVAEGVTAEIIIRDKPLDLTDDGLGVYDPAQFGTSILIVEGTITMHGAIKDPTFTRLSQEPRAGMTTLSLEQPGMGWKPGDRLILPDTRQLKDWERESKYTPQWEELTIASISSDKRTITLTNPLQFDHRGAYDGDGITLRFLPHVGNLSRNVIIRSENPSGTRGHTQTFHRAAVDIRYVLFRDLARTTIDPLDSIQFDSNGSVTHIGTNQIARYPVHTHHLIGPENTSPGTYQYKLIGNAIDGGPSQHKFKWGMTIHGSHYGLIKQNIVYNMAGAGIAFEDGSESYNVLEENFVVRVFGPGGRADSGGDHMIGSQGTSFWFHGINNYVRDNVAANVNPKTNTFGYVLFNRGAKGLIPAWKGADPKENGLKVNVHAIPILEFTGNEAYGGLNGGMVIWDVGANWVEKPQGGEQSIIKDFRAWHTWGAAWWHYEISNILVDGLVVRGDPTYPDGVGVQTFDYLADRLTIRNADIQGKQYGLVVPYSLDSQNPTFIVEDSYFRNKENILIESFINCCGPDLNPRKAIIKNIKFDKMVGFPLRPIKMAWVSEGELSFRYVDLIELTEVFVIDYNQEPGVNFQVFFKEQAPDYIVPQANDLHTGSPQKGLTNQQNWNLFGIAIAGAVAPCLDDTTYPEIAGGFVCPTSSNGGLPPDLIPPQAPVGLVVQ